MTHNENARAAYADGNIKLAALYEQILTLEDRCERYEAALEAIATGDMTAKQAAGAAYEVL